MLTMTILVKNEADIIEHNIRTHASLGVDSFVVMDNNSNDGTREILDELSKEFEITIIDEKGTYNQAKWMTKLTHIAKKRYNSRWLIPNDADEFWIPNSNTLKEALPSRGSVLSINRYNMLLYRGLDNFLDSEYMVANPVYYSKKAQLSRSDISLPLTKISPKVIVKPKGLLWIRGGNHKALHLQNFRDYFKQYDKIKRFEDISVYHYPIRSFEQFKANIENRKLLLAKGAKMGPHYKRWVELLNKGLLEDEFYSNILFNNEELKVLQKYAIVDKIDIKGKFV